MNPHAQRFMLALAILAVALGAEYLVSDFAPGLALSFFAGVGCFKIAEWFV